MASTKTRDVGTSNLIGGSLREDLAGYISNISRDETPLLSTIGTNKAKSQRHDWQTDTLRNPEENAQGSDFSFDTANAVNDVPTRLSNYTQVFGKTIHVAGSLIKSDFAGAEDYFVYQMKKRKREIMRDIEREALLWAPQPGTSGANTNRILYNNAEGGHMGSLLSYTNNWVSAGTGTFAQVARGGGETNITTTAGTAFNVDADGTSVVQYRAGATLADAALTEAHINSLAGQVFDNGGMLKTAQIPTSRKSTVSNLFIAGNGGAAQRRADNMASKVATYVDMIMIEFGFQVSLYPNYVMENYNSATATTGVGVPNMMFIYDPSMIKRSVLTGLTTEEDGTARYGKGYIMYCEETLEIMNPNSLSAVVGFSG